MVSFGVTGHRSLADVDALKAGLVEVFQYVDQVSPGEEWSIISSLAEGADRLVAREVLRYKPGARLVVPLPLPVEQYAQDFTLPGSRDEFYELLHQAIETIPPPAESHGDGYRAAGESMLNHCDILIALWDGQDAHGKGGTGEIVDLARKKGMPVAWVKCGNRKPGSTEPYSLGDEQGQVQFERF
jgi:hypothetical protein